MTWHAARVLAVVSAAAALADWVSAQPVVTADVLDSGDPGGPAPANRTVVDVHVDVDASDRWNATGIVLQTAAGTQLVYRVAGGGVVLLNPPGTTSKFVTFFSNPEPRDADSRYTGGIVTANAYSFAGSRIATASELDVRATPSISFPGEVGEDGFVARLVFDTSAVTGIVPGSIALFTGVPPPGHTSLATASVLFAATTGVPAGVSTMFTLAALGCPPSGRLYVNQAAAPGGFGHSWSTPYADVQSALDHAVACTGTVEIWVARGTYRAAPAGGPRSKAFVVYSRTSIHGGFSGHETLKGERDVVANPTILSGDFNGDDTAIWGQNTADNAYHVVETSGDSIPPVIDGFTITGGWADDPANAIWRRGGGVYARGDDPVIIRNCAIRLNYAMDGGAAFWNNGSQPGTIVENCTIELNRTTGNGIMEMQAAGALINSLIARNTGPCTLSFTESRVELYSCTIAGNDAGPGGSVLCGPSGTPDLAMYNTIVHGNSGGYTGNIAATYSNTQSVLFPGAGNLSVDPRFVNAAAGDFRLGSGSPCIDSGDTTAVAPQRWTFDLDGLPRLVDEPSAPNIGVPEDPHVVVDMGAYEYHGCAADFNRSGTVSVQDLFDYLAAFFSGCP